MIQLGENLVVAYWLQSVGIGPVNPPPPGVLPGLQRVKVPVTDVLQHKRSDGSPHINVINLTGANFTKSDHFEPPYLDIEEDLFQILSDGHTVKALQSEGIKVVLCIVGGHGIYGWQTIPTDKIRSFVAYLKSEFLDGYGLDGIDIDDEYYGGEKQVDTIVSTVQTMAETFPKGKIISKALFRDGKEIIPRIKDYLTYGGIMYYGNNVTFLKECYEHYRAAGLKHSQLLIGVNAGPAEEQPDGNFTSLKSTEELTQWQPADGKKLGMMIWSFSQDIQQWTTYPQNQEVFKYPNQNDHLWQRTIIEVMDLEAAIFASIQPNPHLRGGAVEKA